MERPDARKRGFTLVEMLVSVTIFSLGMTALVVALRVGIGAWQQTKAAQSREAQLERAIAILRQDVRQAFRASEDTPALSEGNGPDGSETLTLTTRLTPKPGYPPPAGIWAEVTYSIQEVDRETVLVRNVRPHVGPAPQTAAMYEEKLLPGARAIQYSYVTPQGTLPKWEQKAAWPLALRVQVKLDSAGPCQFSISLPQSNAK